MRTMGRTAMARLLAGITVIAAIFLAAPAASAQQAVTVTNGGSYSAGLSPGPATLTVNGVVFVECAFSPMSLSVSSGGFTTPADIGDVSLTLTSCLAGSNPVTVTGSVGDIVVTGYNSGTQISTMYLGPVDLHYSALGCDFDVAGHATFSYDNLGGLDFSPGGPLPPGIAPLHVGAGATCLGLVNAGDPVGFTAAYQISGPPFPVVS
ncbi:hypothetical protein BAY61_06575 [Prauserella marina]|uniref:Uncharacterized protein n=1 Tax=Prauserella marina TaxID=530584 RepID=A0A222VL96_9PSEU|nr:hypothetical protein [Prauserella marina]ASR34699.1 hypothetical protein BAY61_06575 [Prauserella marina]PWV85642.1 hypothetical protein DES30_1011670 [Prauserella marina]SDC49603.1 hypothetical protein SAMN05421630_102321 [Prauserella marina]